MSFSGVNGVAPMVTDDDRAFALRIMIQVSDHGVGNAKFDGRHCSAHLRESCRR